MVVGGETRMSLRVVADMDEELGRVLGHSDAVEERSGPRALFVHGDRRAGTAVGIPDGISTSLGDPGQECPRGDRPLDGTLDSEAISGYSAQSLLGKCKATVWSLNP